MRAMLREIASLKLENLIHNSCTRVRMRGGKHLTAKRAVVSNASLKSTLRFVTNPQPPNKNSTLKITRAPNPQTKKNNSSDKH